MKFDVKRFRRAKFQPRTELVPVPDLRSFFDEVADTEAPAWKVRGLTGQELGFVNETAQRNKDISSILEGLVSGDSGEKIRSIKEMLGMADGTPDDIARRLEMLVLGSVEPTVDMELAVKLCKCFPIEFYQLTNKITQLTGAGHVPGESQGSGNVQMSEPV